LLFLSNAIAVELLPTGAIIDCLHMLDFLSLLSNPAAAAAAAAAAVISYWIMSDIPPKIY
jgi:hypothetical protein